jgi:putative transcriptional regulator
MTGSLLIAQPLLNDGFFNRAVILLTNHGEEGVVGFILNFKTHMVLRDVRPQMKYGNYPIYEGGPVSKNQLFFIHTLGERIEGALPIGNNMFFGGDFQQMLDTIENEAVLESEVRFFVGYSGWDKEQLDEELSKQSWFVREDAHADILKKDPFDIWADELEKQNKNLRIFGEIGCDPSLN